MPSYERIVILTGAGLSAESGLATFRDPDGVWAKYDCLEVATPEGFARNLEPSAGASLFAEAIHGRASEIVPAYVACLLGG